MIFLALFSLALAIGSFFVEDRELGIALAICAIIGGLITISQL